MGASIRCANDLLDLHKYRSSKQLRSLRRHRNWLKLHLDTEVEAKPCNDVVPGGDSRPYLQSELGIVPYPVSEDYPRREVVTTGTKMDRQLQITGSFPTTIDGAAAASCENGPGIVESSVSKDSDVYGVTFTGVQRLVATSSDGTADSDYWPHTTCDAQASSLAVADLCDETANCDAPVSSLVVAGCRGCTCVAGIQSRIDILEKSVEKLSVKLLPKRELRMYIADSMNKDRYERFARYCSRYHTLLDMLDDLHRNGEVSTIEYKILLTSMQYELNTQCKLSECVPILARLFKMLVLLTDMMT